MAERGDRTGRTQKTLQERRPRRADAARNFDALVAGVSAVAYDDEEQRRRVLDLAIGSLRV